MTSFMALDGVTSILQVKDVTVTCKRMRHRPTIGGNYSVQWRKVGRSWKLWMCFRRSLCVRIEIDQLHSVNSWIIIHCLSVSCSKTNHSRCALVIWSSLQLTSKQWIITQQFTTGADLFLKYIAMHKVQMEAGTIRKLLYGLCVCMGENPLAKARGYLPVQTHKPYNLHM